MQDAKSGAGPDNPIPSTPDIWGELASPRYETATVYQHRTHYFVQCDDVHWFGPFLVKEMHNWLRENAGGDHWARNPIPVTKIVRELGGRQRFGVYKGELHWCDCPLRTDVEPERHPEIEQWLTVCFGDDGRKMIEDWLTLVPEDCEELIGLWIHGPANTGKTLLPNALARLWDGTRTPVEAQRASGRFNDSLASSPIVHADETPPLRGTKTINIDWIRTITTATTQKIEPKGEPVQELAGMSRLVVSTNPPPGAFVSGLDDVSLSALGQRFLVVRAKEAGAGYLRENAGDFQALFHGDALAEHTRWLWEQWEDGKRELPVGTRHDYIDGSGAEAFQAAPRGGGENALDVIVGAVLDDPQGAEGPFRRMWRGQDVLAWSGSWLVSQGFEDANAITKVLNMARRPNDRVRRPGSGSGGKRHPWIAIEWAREHARRGGEL